MCLVKQGHEPQSKWNTKAYRFNRRGKVKEELGKVKGIVYMS